MQIFKHHRNTFIIMLIGLLLQSCATLAGKETPGEYIDDATITARVKSAILKDTSLNNYEIKVETFQNEVQLSGFIDSPREAAKAGRIARGIKGVKSVKNDLIVRKHEK